MVLARSRQPLSEESICRLPRGSLSRELACQAHCGVCGVANPGTRARRSASLRSGRVPWPGAHVPKGCRSKTEELAMNDRYPVDVVLAGTAGCPPPMVDAYCRPTWNPPHRPGSNNGKVRPGPTCASRVPTASQAIEQARPLTRTVPDLGRQLSGRCGRLPAHLTRRWHPRGDRNHSPARQIASGGFLIRPVAIQ